MTTIFWIALFAQMAMGAFDTIYHHEGTERLAWRPEQAGELRLHGVRNLAYAVLFMALGWSVPMGGWAVALMLLLLGELFITLWDFVEEDRTRKLPATERLTHTLLTLNYGIVLALLVPWLWANAGQPTALAATFHGMISWMCAAASVGVIVSGLRDLVAAARCKRLVRQPAQKLATALHDRKSILITGGTGFIGKRLVEALAAAGHEVTLLTRKRANAAALLEAGPLRVVTQLDQIKADVCFDAIINLAGEPISDSPWTRAKRFRIVRSRLRMTYDVMRLIGRLTHKPDVLISGSAIGWYGLRGDQMLTEANLGADCFSRRVCSAWERAAGRAAKYGVRTVLLRTGLVLDNDGGMLARMLTPFEFGLGGRFGDGKHWMSWIHRDDLVRMIIHAIAKPNLKGPLNAVSPEPVTNQNFTKALANALNRPAILPVPAWPLRALLGEFAHELLLSGQRVYPEKAMHTGFVFRYPTIDAAFGVICGAKRGDAMVGAEEAGLASAMQAAV
jgi:uncharacterized protein